MSCSGYGNVHLIYHAETGNTSVYAMNSDGGDVYRFITISASGTTSSSNFDLRTLRAVRVLRPLKLVSGVPSTYTSCGRLNSRLPASFRAHIKHFVVHSFITHANPEYSDHPRLSLCVDLYPHDKNGWNYNHKTCQGIVRRLRFLAHQLN